MRLWNTFIRHKSDMTLKCNRAIQNGIHTYLYSQQVGVGAGRVTENDDLVVGLQADHTLLGWKIPHQRDTDGDGLWGHTENTGHSQPRPRTRAQASDNPGNSTLHRWTKVQGKSQYRIEQTDTGRHRFREDWY